MYNDYMIHKMNAIAYAVGYKLIWSEDNTYCYFEQQPDYKFQYDERHSSDTPWNPMYNVQDAMFIALRLNLLIKFNERNITVIHYETLPSGHTRQIKQSSKRYNNSKHERKMQILCNLICGVAARLGNNKLVEAAKNGNQSDKDQKRTSYDFSARQVSPKETE